MRTIKLLSIGILSLFLFFACQSDDDFTAVDTAEQSNLRKPKPDIGIFPIKFTKHNLEYDCEDHVFQIDNLGYIQSTPDATFYFYTVAETPGIYMQTEWNLLSAHVTSPETASVWRTERINNNLYYFEYIGNTWYGYEYVLDWALDITILKRP